MLRLNQAHEDEHDFDRVVRRAKRVIDAVPPDGSSGVSWERYFESCAKARFNVGMEAYRFEQPAEAVRWFLADSARHYIFMYGKREQPTETDDRNPWTFLGTVGLIVCFCQPFYRKVVAGMDERRYRFPLHRTTEHLAAYLGQLKKHLKGEGADVDLCRRLADAVTTEHAGPDERLFLRPELLALASLTQGDEAAWHESISEMLTTHERECETGEYRLSNDGYFSLPALMYAKLGAEHGMRCSLSSLYLPLQLLAP